MIQSKWNKLEQVIAAIALGLVAPVALAAEPVAPKSTSAKASALSTAEYGEIYVIEQRAGQKQMWRVGLNGEYEFGNAYSHVFGLSQTFERRLGQFFWAGIKLDEYTQMNTTLFNTLQSDALGNQFAFRSKSPTMAATAIGTIVPFSGHWSFFGNRPLASELGVRIGVGAVSYRRESLKPLMTWSLRPTIYLSEKVGVQMGFGQDIDSPFNSNRYSRFKGEFGLTLQF